MTAPEFQKVGAKILQRHVDHVCLEWSAVKGARDDFVRDPLRYAPRVDIAVGPFSTDPGRDPRIEEALLPESLRARLEGLEPNPNPRCLLAIEVIFSGSSKHMMGDILNASALGLYGLVVGTDKTMPKIQRIDRYLELLARLDKAPWLFRNVLPMSTKEFKEILA